MKDQSFSGCYSFIIILLPQNYCYYCPHSHLTYTHHFLHHHRLAFTHPNLTLHLCTSLFLLLFVFYCAISFLTLKWGCFFSRKFPTLHDFLHLHPQALFFEKSNVSIPSLIFIPSLYLLLSLLVCVISIIIFSHFWAAA